MIPTVLVGLDGSEGSEAAVELGITWAKRANAMLVGIGIIDEPTIAHAPPVLLGSPYADPIVYRERMADARREVEQFLETFALACSNAGVAFKLLEDVGLPSIEIVREAQRFDAVLLGSRTRFHFEIQERVDETLSRVIRDSPRPVVAVPPDRSDGPATLIAFDGSLQAARALQAFVATRLGESMPTHVLTIGEDRVKAARTAERAIDFLDHHGIAARAHTIKTNQDVGSAILSKAHELDAGLIVAGAYGQPALKEFILGSATKTLLRKSRIALFLSH
jgi:nucleotide-binding universal stress UspA family protein